MILLTNTVTIITGWWVLPATGNGGRQRHIASEWLKWLSADTACCAHRE